MEHTHNHSDCGGCGCHEENHNHTHEHSHCGCSHQHYSQCSCGHNHEDIKLPLPRLISGSLIFAAAVVCYYLFNRSIITVIPFISAYILLGYDILINAVKRLFKGHILDENFLMSAASIGAFILGDFPEAVAVMLFYRIGETLQEYAVDKSRKSITELMDIRPDYANTERDGNIITLSPENVHKGDIIIVKNGEKVPLDGIIVNGSTYMDTVALTGESVPRKTEPGNEVLSGFINTGAAVHIEVTKEYNESTVARILEAAQNAQEKKTRSEQFITRFAKYYTPIVVAIAVLIMIIPSVITLNPSEWISKGLIFLVISCPCALVVSVPLGFFAGIGCASRNGILVKGSTYLEALSKLKTVVFDKTGTLTEGIFEVQKINSLLSEEQLLEYAAYAESYSNHPIAKAIQKRYDKPIERRRISDYTETAGLGISAEIDDNKILCGNMRLMNENKIDVSDENISFGTAVYIAVNGEYAGSFIISDKEKEDSIDTVSGLNALGIEPVMLTGDTKENAEHICKHLGIEKFYSSLLPQDKTARMEQIIHSCIGTAAFMGDGINDAPVLALADIGIAMGGLGSDSAVEAADIVFMTDEPSRLLKAIQISKKTIKIVRQNIVFAIGVKILVMILGVLGITGMWLAIFADVGVALIAVLNSLRALR